MNNFEFALPIIKRYNFTACFFITTGWIGTGNPHGEACVGKSELRQLAAAGMTIGSHTVSHPWLARIPIADARRELQESKQTLEDIIGQPVDWLSYPSGSFNPAVQDLARELGYKGACSVIRDNRQTASQLYHLPRVMIMNDTSLRRFRYYLSPLYHYLHFRKNRKRWGAYA